MKFRRKSAPTPDVAPAPEVAVEPTGPGPHDAADLRDGVERVDLGSLLVAPSPGRELRLQVNEATNEVGAVLLVGGEGALELQAFSAARSGGLWAQVRPQIVADVVRRGGTCTEREGRFGTELVCRVPGKMPDGSPGVQFSRIVGIDGPRWMLRATLLGRPAAEPETAGEWEDAIAQVAVRRGDQAMPVGRPLPVVLPPEARRSS